MRFLCAGLLLMLQGSCTEQNPGPRPDRPLAVEAGGSEQGLLPAELGQADAPGGSEDGPARADRSRVDQTSPPVFPTVKGKATYYDATGAGNCSFEPTSDLMVGAMNQIEYQGSEACGACVKVIGPKATIVIRIVDRCPECLAGHIDLSQQAFAKIADPVLGVVPITWQYVACNVTGPIAYKFKEGSNQWWTAIQVRNTRYAVKRLEAKLKGVFVVLPRQTYNYFVQSSGLGPGPYELRVTDVLGHVLVDTGIPHQERQVVPGAAQFPL